MGREHVGAVGVRVPLAAGRLLGEQREPRVPKALPPQEAPLSANFAGDLKDPAHAAQKHPVASLNVKLAFGVVVGETAEKRGHLVRS